jgi:heavy-metal resistance protein
MIRLFAAAAIVCAACAAGAQPHQPYAGMQQRPVKALSEQEIADLRAGRGMGLALPAELNGYPGPIHVLEHADALSLTPEQRRRTQALYEAMTAEAIPLGEQLIARETELDRAFATRTVTPQTLAEKTAAIGATQGALRAAHLRYHLAQMEVLTPEQMRRYAELRGYAGGGHGDAGRAGAHRPGGHHGR